MVLVGLSHSRPRLRCDRLPDYDAAASNYSALMGETRIECSTRSLPALYCTQGPRDWQEAIPALLTTDLRNSARKNQTCYLRGNGGRYSTNGAQRRHTL